MENILTLYHGASYDFDAIDLLQGRPYKDFGQGLYAKDNGLLTTEALRIIMETKTFDLLQDRLVCVFYWGRGLACIFKHWCVFSGSSNRLSRT